MTRTGTLTVRLRRRAAGPAAGASRFSSPFDAVSLKMTVGTVTGVLRLARRSQEAERLSLSCGARPGLPAASACDGPGRASRAAVTRSRLHSISPRRLHGSSSRISASTEAAPINYLSFYNWQYSTILANEKNRVRFSSHLGTHYHPVSLKVTVLMARSLAISGWPGHRRQGRLGHTVAPRRPSQYPAGPQACQVGPGRPMISGCL